MAVYNNEAVTITETVQAVLFRKKEEGGAVSRINKWGNW